MANQDKSAKIVSRYLSDEHAALQDWYREYRTQETGIPGTEVSLPDFAKLNKTFEQWLDNSKEALFKTICVEWNYAEKKQQEKFKETSTLVIALVDYLIAQHTNIPSPLAVVSLLVLRGLDKFCGK